MPSKWMEMTQLSVFLLSPGKGKQTVIFITTDLPEIGCDKLSKSTEFLGLSFSPVPSRTLYTFNSSIMPNCSGLPGSPFQRITEAVTVCYSSLCPQTTGRLWHIVCTPQMYNKWVSSRHQRGKPGLPHFFVFLLFPLGGGHLETESFHDSKV